MYKYKLLCIFLNYRVLVLFLWETRNMEKLCVEVLCKQNSTNKARVSGAGLSTLKLWFDFWIFFILFLVKNNS